ncbi:18129_t:CDS:1, partial [Dentiscutata erythropus]
AWNNYAIRFFEQGLEINIPFNSFSDSLWSSNWIWTDRRIVN